jgi:signal transduction histidine kinase
MAAPRLVSPAPRDDPRSRLLGLGLDLHDGPLQEAAALGAELYCLRTQLADMLGERDPAVAGADRLIRVTGTLTEHLRELAVSASAAPARRLAPPLSAELADAVDLYVDACDVDLELEPTPAAVDAAVLPQPLRTAIVRVVQGALANVAQHSGAYLARVTVRLGAEEVEIDVEDDGCGFDVADRLRASERRGGLGLVGLHRRAVLLGGELRLDSRPGGPTRLRVRLPRAWSFEL